MVSVLGELVTLAFGLLGSFSGAYTAVFLMGIWMPFVNSWVSCYETFPTPYKGKIAKMCVSSE